MKFFALFLFVTSGGEPNMGNDHEVEFHEIKIGGQMIWLSWDQIILPVFMRSKFLTMIQSPDCSFFMRSKLANNAFFEFWSHEQFVSHKCNHEMETF